MDLLDTGEKMCKNKNNKEEVLKCVLCGETFTTTQEKLDHLLEHRRVGEII